MRRRPFVTQVILRRPPSMRRQSPRIS
jgi:hypothetical protein